MHLVLFFSKGVSLSLWEKLGILDRETALYRRLLSHLGGITFVTYGGPEDLSFLPRLGGINLICNRFRLSESLYPRLLPHLLPRTAPLLFKSNQVTGSDVALNLARALKVKFLARCGYLWSLHLDWQNGVEASLRREVTDLERRMFQGADGVSVTTRAMAAAVVSRYGVGDAKVRVIPNYVETDLFHPDFSTPPKEGRVLMVGRLRRDGAKNLPALLSALAGMDVELVVAGDGPERGRMEEMARQLGVVARFLGDVPNKDLPDLYRSSAIFVLPSFSEGHPKALLEAMACGCPVVGTRVRGIIDVVQHGQTGWLCDLDPLALRQAIQEGLGDREQAAAMGRRAAAWVMETCSLERVVARELCCYHGILSGEGRSFRHRLPGSPHSYQAPRS